VVHPPQTPLAESLARGKPILLDGGLATELEAQGFDLDTPLWSAELLLKEPQAIRAAHRAFLKAGAEVLITASYQLSAMGLERRGTDGGLLEELLVASVRLAVQAREEGAAMEGSRCSPVLVAASLGPFGAALADGSEYTGDYGIGDAALSDFHRGRLALLDRSGADILACETIPSLQEARVLCDLLDGVATPAWISFSCADGVRLHDGSSIRAAAELFAEHPRVFAVGVNCTAPRFITAIIDVLKDAAPKKAVVVYPNSGESFEAETGIWHGTVSSSECGRAALEWYARGATLIGGCCRMGPQHIRTMAQSLWQEKDAGEV